MNNQKFEETNDETRPFDVTSEQELLIKHTLLEVHSALTDKGYDPVSQIVGYILSEDPTYITNYKNARSLIRKIDRDELLSLLVRSYIDRNAPKNSGAQPRAQQSDGEAQAALQHRRGSKASSD